MDPTSQPTLGSVMTFLMISVFDWLIIKPYDYPNVLWRNLPILKCLNGFIGAFAVGNYFTNDLAFMHFIKYWRHDVKIPWDQICRYGVFTLCRAERISWINSRDEAHDRAII
jgi:hypothetical protein